MSKSRIIVSQDYSDPVLAYRQLRRLPPDHCRVKVGKELFYLVIGRPILQAPDHLEALLAIEREIALVRRGTTPARPAGGKR
ncbi:MAG TPA: hypothetical protein VJN91_08980 [Gammaproteobacteria bacterium]|nr:hypothetical protein [Gammaproteobacteria bacterium]